MSVVESDNGLAIEVDPLHQMFGWVFRPGPERGQWVSDREATLRELGAAMRRKAQTQGTAGDVYTRRDLDAALEGLRVNVTEEVTDAVIRKIGEWMRTREQSERAQGSEETAELLDELVGDLYDGEWRRENDPEKTT